MLTFEQFSEINKQRCEAKDGFNHLINSWSLSDWITATIGEFGEMANIAKKLNRVRDGITGNEKSPAELHQDLEDEIADIFIYLDLLAQSEGIDLAEAVIRKFNKTSKKVNYPIFAVNELTAEVIAEKQPLEERLDSLKY